MIDRPQHALVPELLAFNGLWWGEHQATANVSNGPAVAAQIEGKSRDDLVFTSKAGTVLRVSRFRPYVFAPAVARCRAVDPQCPIITPHDLRHTAASLAISVGANVKAVQPMLGHESAALTLDTYADLFSDDLDAVASALNKLADSAR